MTENLNPTILFVWYSLSEGWSASLTDPGNAYDALQIEVEQGQQMPLLWENDGTEVHIDPEDVDLDLEEA